MLVDVALAKAQVLHQEEDIEGQVSVWNGSRPRAQCVQFVCVMCLIASQFCIFLVKLDKPKHVLIEEQSGSKVTTYE